MVLRLHVGRERKSGANSRRTPSVVGDRNVREKSATIELTKPICQQTHGHPGIARTPQMFAGCTTNRAGRASAHPHNLFLEASARSASCSPACTPQRANACGVSPRPQAERRRAQLTSAPEALQSPERAGSARERGTGHDAAHLAGLALLLAAAAGFIGYRTLSFTAPPPPAVVELPQHFRLRDRPQRRRHAAREAIRFRHCRSVQETDDRASSNNSTPGCSSATRPSTPPRSAKSSANSRCSHVGRQRSGQPPIICSRTRTSSRAR